MSGSSHIQSVLIAVEYRNFCRTLEVYLLFATLLGQIKSKLNYRLVTYKIRIPTGRDSATFRDNGTEVPSLSRDKGTTGQAKNLAKGRDGLGDQNPGRDAGQNGTEQKRTF